MRVEYSCRAALQEITDHGVIRTRNAARHLKSCPHCRARLAGYALGWSRMGENLPSNEDQFADLVMHRIEHRASRRRLYRIATYTLGSILAGVAAGYFAGSEIINSALLPLWQYLAVGVAKLPSIGQSLITEVGKLFTGQVMIALCAALALLWVGMLDKVAGLIRLHRA